ncbi:hypothetical protein ACE01N_12680 [Saccharicrinis sp. FJH2]|uniref:hypothetical protein n=1 Tax=Saccharicrinis sp. FJH65 TaxID=3344659 RepID=UPI0035F49E18
MKIDRSHIIERLFQFSQEGNGVIIGKPGIGKSYSIAELAEILVNKNIPVVILPIDTILDGTDSSIESEIESNGNWISYLDKIKLSEGEKAVLVFDAYDAARDEKLKKEILIQIKKAISKLHKWNVLVSVRTYDATKSPQLLRLFGNQNVGNGLSCRYFEIPDLTDSELDSVFKDNPTLEKLYQTADIELKRILKIPFFLRLLEIVEENASSSELEEIKLIKSETELLNKYWNSKITNTDDSYKKEAFLKSLAEQLVENKSLSCKKEQFLSDEETFKKLRSDDLISEVGVGERNIAFSHNILFDYMAGRLVIPIEPKELLNFITEDKSRPFFLRPSFIFYFTNLWYQYRDSFWKNYDYLGKESDSNILLFKRLIPTSVIANEYDSIKDIEPVFRDHDIIQQLLQSIRFLSNRKIEQKDIELLYNLSNQLDVHFLWDYAFIFERILLNESVNDIEKFGLISRRFLAYILEEQKKQAERNQSLDRLGSTRGVEFVSKTFKSNPEESIKLFREVLNLLKEPNFEIWYFSSLSDDLEYFVADAPEFVAEIYQRIFFHSETSDAKTNMGTVTLNLVSNRRQDFDMCYYRLVELFPKFLSASPSIAIETGISIVNMYVKQDKLYVINENYESLNEVNIKNLSSHFLPDLSSMWHDSLAYNKPAQLIEKIIDFFILLANENKVTELTQYLDVYVSNAIVGFIWKKLLEFANEYPKLLCSYLYELLLNPIILTSSDTTYESGISINKIFPLLKVEQREKLEETILKLLNEKGEEGKKYAENKVNRLLNCIPKELLESEDAINIVEHSAPIRNEPTFKTSWSSEPYTTDKWLKDQGVDLEKEKNKQIYDLISELQPFNSQRMNDSPSRGDFIKLLPIANELFELTKNGGYEKDLEFSSFKEVFQFYSIITRNASQIEETDYQQAWEAIQFGLEYISEYDESFDESNSPSSGYSPTPRIEASNALIGLFSFKNEDSIYENIKAAVKDSNPVVRFNVLKNIALLWESKPEGYWEIVLERLQNETDSFTIATVLNNVYRKKIINEEERVINVIEIAATRIKEFKKRDSFTKTYSGLLLFLLDNKKNKVAQKILYDNLNSTDFIQTLVSRLFDFIDPKYTDNDYTVESTRKELIQLFKDAAFENIKMLKNDDPSKFSIEDSPERDRLFLIDFIIQRIYFGLHINERIDKNDLRPNQKNKRAFYDRIKPILTDIVDNSKEIGGGIMVAHTAHYLVQTLNGVIRFYPEEAQSILDMASKITELSYKTGYTFDPSSITEIVSLTEVLLADHKELLRDDKSLNQLVSILYLYVQSGWTEALELLWKLDEAFK